MYENYTQDEIRLAQKIVQEFDDYKSIRLHLQCGRKYTESFLRTQLQEALLKPQHEINTTRVAYYMWRIKHYDADLRS